MSHPSIRTENPITFPLSQRDPYDMRYLSPPIRELNLINHSADYIAHKDKKGKVHRNIFYGQDYEEEEKEKIKEFENYLVEQNYTLPHNWSKQKTLKYLYSGHFNFEKVLAQIKEHLSWVENIKIQNPTDQNIQKFLKEGIIYSFGRDNQCRPIIVINSHLIKVRSVNLFRNLISNNCFVSSISKKDSTEEIIAVLSTLSRILSVVQKNMFVEGKVENWIIFIETNSIGVLELDFKAIGKIVGCMLTNFTCILHKLFILNPSWIFRQSWRIISAFAPPETNAKVQFLMPEEFSEFQKVGIRKNQLEKKYGGDIPNLTHFWPPANSLEKESDMEEMAHEEEIISFYSFEGHSHIRKENFSKEISHHHLIGEHYSQQNKAISHYQQKDQYSSPRQPIQEIEFEGSQQLDRPQQDSIFCCASSAEPNHQQQTIQSTQPQSAEQNDSCIIF